MCEAEVGRRDVFKTSGDAPWALSRGEKRGHAGWALLVTSVGHKGVAAPMLIGCVAAQHPKNGLGFAPLAFGLLPRCQHAGVS